MYSYRRTGPKHRRRNGSGEVPQAASTANVRAQVRQALGGGIQTKLTVGAPNDAYEQEADRVADRVMRMPDGAITASPAESGLQRMCTECQEELEEGKAQRLQRQPMEEEEEELQPKLRDGLLQRQEEEEEEEETLQPKGRATPGEISVGAATTDRINGMRGKGNSLSLGERNFFEPRFGYDFSSVRVHHGAEAAQSADAIRAKAFTLGQDVFFGSGEYQTDTDSGRRLMAHELTHVVQQRAAGKRVQRMSFGSGAPPHSDYSEVPKKERARVKAAMALVERVVKKPKGYPRCHNFFKDNCVNGTSATLKDKFDKATVWFDKDNSVWGSGVDPDHIAYSAETWRWGRWSLAGVFIHEMMHRCGQDNEATDDRAIVTCGFPDIDKYKRGKTDRK